MNTNITCYKRNISEEAKPTIKSLMLKKPKQFMKKKTWLKKFPVASWLPKYTKEDFIGDLIAGITVGFTVIPQSIAYAELAKLPPQVCKHFELQIICANKKFLVL
jgi:hypothetical protein